MLFLKQPLILTFHRYKSATTCQIDSNKVSNFNLRPDLWNCVKTEMIESTAPTQQPHKRHRFLGHLVFVIIIINDNNHFIYSWIRCSLC